MVSAATEMPTPPPRPAPLLSMAAESAPDPAAATIFDVSAAASETVPSELVTARLFLIDASMVSMIVLPEPEPAPAIETAARSPPASAPPTPRVMTEMWALEVADRTTPPAEVAVEASNEASVVSVMVLTANAAATDTLPATAPAAPATDAPPESAVIMASFAADRLTAPRPVFVTVLPLTSALRGIDDGVDRPGPRAGDRQPAAHAAGDGAGRRDGDGEDVRLLEGFQAHAPGGRHLRRGDTAPRRCW